MLFQNVHIFKDKKQNRNCKVSIFLSLKEQLLVDSMCVHSVDVGVLKRLTLFELHLNTLLSTAAECLHATFLN